MTDKHHWRKTHLRTERKKQVNLKNTRAELSFKNIITYPNRAGKDEKTTCQSKTEYEAI